MTIGYLITLVITLITSATAISVGYLHRKQIRQIELFRQDPKVGIVPPSIPPVAFMKRHWGKWRLVVIGLIVWNIATNVSHHHSAADLAALDNTFQLFLLTGLLIAWGAGKILDVMFGVWERFSGPFTDALGLQLKDDRRIQALSERVAATEKIPPTETEGLV